VFTTGCTPPPVPGGITGNATVCSGSTQVYSINPVPNATSYTWFVPAGSTISAGQGTTTITVTIGNTNGSVYVQANGSCGGGPFSFLYVTVNPIPTPTISGPATACQGTTTNVYTTQAGMSAYSWSVSAGGSIQSGAGTSSVTIAWNTTGAQTVSVNYNNASGCSALTPTVYNVTVNAAATPIITGTNNLCANTGYYTYVTQPGYTGYIWTVSSGGQITGGQGTNAVTIIWNTAGAQSVSVNYANSNGCYATAPVQYPVTVNTVPGAAGAITGTSVVCAGTQGVAYSCAPVTGATAYAWTLPAGYNLASGAGTNSITVNFDATALTGTITVAGNNTCGNGAPSPSFAVTITPLPASAGAVSGPTTVCAGSAGNVYTIPAIANATGYTWAVPTGATITAGQNTNTITVSYSASAVSGSISVYGTNGCGSGALSPLLAVTVHSIPPRPMVTVVGYVLTSSAATGNQWYHNGASVGGATGQTYTVPSSEPGWYWTIVTLSGCASDSSNHVYIAGVGIGELSTGIFEVYPVPNDGHFTASMRCSTETVFNIVVYNELGVSVFQLNDVKVKGTVEKQIDIRTEPAGVYTVVFLNNNNRVSRKILINK
jgi:hypothetical protein